MTTNLKVTLDEFMSMLDDEKPALEYACGEAVQKPMPDQFHSSLQLFLGVVLFNFLERTGLGKVLPEFRCIFGPPGGVRVFVPDLVYIAAGRLTRERYLHAPPDLAIEIFSQDQNMARFTDKIQFYLLHGVRLVWVIDPYALTVAVLAPGQDARVLTSGNTLDGGGVLPGFSVAIDDIFARL